MKIAVVGATGLVGGVMLKVLEEMNFPVTQLIPAASAGSKDRKVTFRGKEVSVVTVEEAIALKPDMAIFSAGSSVSKEYAPKFAAIGCPVIDNSSCWRMDPTVPLVVPEVNSHALAGSPMIIANPNCSTIQLVVALAPLHKKYTIKRLVISTYQSVTGTGKKAVDQLMDERAGKEAEQVYPHPIDLNCFPHGGTFLANGYTTEEQKLVDETRKIMEAPGMAITATVVRIPVKGGHSESVNISFENDFDLAEVKEILRSAPGVVVQDNPAANEYPTPRYSEGRNEVFVGRIRRDESSPASLNLWIVADNLRKGAATNAVQIAECLVKRNR